MGMFHRIEKAASGRVSRVAATIALPALLLFPAAVGSRAEDGSSIVSEQHWSFAGVRGHFDKAQLQRGFQVYREVCSSCHSVKLLSFRNLGEKGGPEFPEEQVKGLAETYKIVAGPNDSGKMFKRPGLPSDRIPGPYDNEQQARASNNGALPPDFSLIALARGVERETPFYMLPWHMLNDILLSGGYQEGGPDYIYSLLNGYKDVPPAYKNENGRLIMVADADPKADVPGLSRCASVGEAEPGKPEVCNKLGDGLYYNAAMAGHQIAMPPPPIADGSIKYTDGTPSTHDNYTRDVAAFLAWAADPKLEERKRMGLMVVLYLLVTAVLLYIAKQRLWAKEPH